MASQKLQTEEEVGSGSALSKWNRKKGEWFAYNGPQIWNRRHNLIIKKERRYPKWIEMQEDASKNGTFKRKLL